jgi:predicted transcriptional regulator
MDQEIGVPWAEVEAAVAFRPSEPPLVEENESRLQPTPGRWESRAKRSEALEHPMRARIFAELQRRPGASASDLSFATGCSYASTRYHLEKLERASLAVPHRNTRPVRYFTAGPLARGDRMGITVLRGPTAARVMALIEQRPGVTKADLGRATGLGGPTIAWHINRLKAAGLIQVGRAGRRVPIMPVTQRLDAIAKALHPEEQDAPEA